MNYSSGRNHFLGSTPRDRRNNVIVMILVIILAVLLFLFFSQRKSNRLIIEEITAQKDSIQTELTQMIAGYDSMKVENDTLTAQMVVSQTKVKDLLKELQQTRQLSFEKITRYQKETTTLREIMRNYIVQIDSLNRRNQILMSENLEVKEQAKKAESRNVQLSEEKEQLEEDLKLAATLEALGITAEALNDRNKDTRFASRASQIRVNFTLSKNITTKRGAKNIYVRIMRPDQLLLTKSPDNLFRFENLKIPYSAVREVNYEGNELPVSVYWDNAGESELIVGEYIIDLFADGNNIGRTTLILK